MDEKTWSKVKGINGAEWGWEFTVLNSVDRIGLTNLSKNFPLVKELITKCMCWGKQDQLEQRP